MHVCRLYRLYNPRNYLGLDVPLQSGVNSSGELIEVSYLESRFRLQAANCGSFAQGEMKSITKLDVALGPSTEVHQNLARPCLHKCFDFRSTIARADLERVFPSKDRQRSFPLMGYNNSLRSRLILLSCFLERG